ncbi:MAG TPA: hypothetical protein VD993_13925 [Chitinophagaceae bacterium]|nr:hypothetical protein [Chitinophagaceae bacterium]
MSQNSRNQKTSGRNEHGRERGDKDLRTQNAANPGLSAGEEDVERGRGNENKGSRSRLSSIDYDRNAE